MSIKKSIDVLPGKPGLSKELNQPAAAAAALSEGAAGPEPSIYTLRSDCCSIVARIGNKSANNEAPKNHGILGISGRKR
jgi:hypothetical protein